MSVGYSHKHVITYKNYKGHYDPISMRVLDCKRGIVFTTLALWLEWTQLLDVCERLRINEPEVNFSLSDINVNPRDHTTRLNIIRNCRLVLEQSKTV